MTVIAIPKILRDRLTDEGADALIVEDRFERRLSEEIGSLRNELIKWMFIFWIGQFASIVGVLSAILFAFFRK